MADSKNCVMTLTSIQQSVFTFFRIFGFQQTECGHMALSYIYIERIKVFDSI
jgi:hypothetical protein